MDLSVYRKDRCSVCGREAQVFRGTQGYCLDCYNHLADYLADVPSPTNDAFHLLALDPEGHAVEFAVERYSMGEYSRWTANELVGEDDPRRSWGYVGRSVSVTANMTTLTQEQVLDALSVKVQRVVGRASMDALDVLAGRAWETSARRPGQVLWARESGSARVACDEDGRPCVVVDGQRLSGQQFLDLLSCYEGSDLYWQVRDASDDGPEWL